MRLRTVTESPVLQREGYTQNEFEKSGNTVPTMEGERPLHPFHAPASGSAPEPP